LKYSIIIPVHNKVELTTHCLDDCFNSGLSNFECIVIDNASSDSTASVLASRPENITTISNNINLGCAKSWNQGIKTSTGDWVIILNNDVRMPKDSLSKMMLAAIEYNFDVISPAMREGILNYNLTEYAELFINSMRNVSRKRTANGACFAVKREVFDKIGLFDENFQIGQYEDADFFRRCKLHKISMGITGRSFIHHYGSSTQRLVQETSGNYAKINQLYHRKKWNLGFFKRHLERYKEQFSLKCWSYLEYYSKGHTLLEKFRNGRLYYH
jgi:N-acetylglucosaminyl-diphospho-decaprenol L-rhamnosyltransferase